MSDYYEALVASGATHDEAARHVYANDMQAWRNREHPMYGRLAPENDSEWCAFVAQTCGESP
ncbi:hypothetical protein [Noviluteimonas gilva]|uniref:Uncharacterized protein n=1 Tax=Noviluteimonas gilva TaxID=2682097 RepID=A0A7C9HL82_9GAMM|nr:hypothetical protein [Lysobacter gilvus]MUV13535.1 hypothetical protein [Lysobacter gilvus]